MERERDKKNESETETFEQNENEIFTLKRSTYRDQLLCIMSGKCINLDTFYYVIFFVCKRKRPLLFFFLVFNKLFFLSKWRRETENEKGKNAVKIMLAFSN